MASPLDARHHRTHLRTAYTDTAPRGTTAGLRHALDVTNAPSELVRDATAALPIGPPEFATWRPIVLVKLRTRRAYPVLR